MKDVIKSGGEWVSSLALESIASAVERRRRGGGDRHSRPAMGRAAILLIVGAETFDRSAVEEALRAVFDAEVAAGKLSKWAVPEDIRFVDEIAKTSVGKIDKKALRAALT